MKLSIKAKPFISAKPKGVIISWNILSDTLADPVLQSVSNVADKPLFSPSYFKKRISLIITRLKEMIDQHKYPIFCLQEVNDSKDDTRSFVHILTRFFQDHHYIVLSSNFGTFDKIYPELGILTAIPSFTYDMISFETAQIIPSSPNSYISTTLRHKASPETFTLVNTHFPAKFQDPKFMKQVCEAFWGHSFASTKIIVCGDFNTSSHDPWYLALRRSYRSLPNQSQTITHLSIQRRDRRLHHNSVFQGFLDHFFWTSDISLSLLTILPNRLSNEDILLLQNPPKNNIHILPSVENPSDHFPLEVSFQLL